LAATYAHYRAVLAGRDAQLGAIEADLAGWYDRPPFADAVDRLAAYRGVTRLGALTLASEVGDWRRFPQAAAFAGFCGLVPSEYSSGPLTRRGHITKTGNAHLRAQLVESAWAYQHRPAVGVGLRERQQRLDPRSSPGPGRPSCGCAAASGAWPHARTPRTSSLRPSPASSPGSCGRRCWRPDVSHPAVTLSGARMAASRTPRRGTAAAGPTPASTMRRPRRRAASQGHLPARSRPAVPTREHQCGGSPIHHAPARRAEQGARPPPDLAGSHTTTISLRPPPTASPLHAQHHAIHQRKPSR
jgi:Transposase IS116/IS110/IS902 family